MITSARYPLTGHVLYLKTIAGTDVVTIRVGESQVLVVLDDERPDAPFASGEEVTLWVDSGQVHIQPKRNPGISQILGGLFWMTCEFGRPRVEISQARGLPWGSG